MQNPMMMFTFSFFDHKYLSWTKIKNCAKLNLIQRLIRICKIQQQCLFYLFQTENRYPFLGKFGPKNCNCQFKLKIGTQTNFNIKNSIMMFTFFCFRPEVQFFWKFIPKKNNNLLKLKFRIQINLNMQNSMVIFFFFLVRKYPFLC